MLALKCLGANYFLIIPVYNQNMCSDMEPEPVRCGCGAVVGKIISIKGQPWLMLGDAIIVRTAFGVCARCGEQFHYSVADRVLSTMVREILHEKQLLIRDPG